MQRLRRLSTVALVALASGYLLVAAFFFAIQRRLLFPAPPPRELHITGAQLLAIPYAGGTAHALWKPGLAGTPVVVHFHGNAEQLADLDELAGIWHGLGFGFFAVEFPGYGASADRGPSEAAILGDAEAALAHLHERLNVPVARTVLEGRSLGTGVAVAMAARGLGSRLILISPYTSIPDVAQRVLPFLPARLLVRDRFDSLARASQVHVPVVVLHGTHDEVIPYEMGKKLAAALSATFLSVDAGHNDTLDTGPVMRVMPQVWYALDAFAATGNPAGEAMPDGQPGAEGPFGG